MLVTACASSFANKIRPPRGGQPTLSLVDLPKYIRDELGLHGMNLVTPLLAGCDRALLTRIVENADKVGCPCLSLIEPTPQPLYELSKAEAAEDRVKRVIQAAQWLGCSSVSICVDAPIDEDAMLEVAERLRPIVRKAEKMDVNVCISSGPGLTASADRITELLKKIGGFRVGSFPDFRSAKDSGDPGAYLRKLVPYAATVLAVLDEPSDADSRQSGGATAAPKPKGKKAKSKDAEPEAEAPKAPVSMGLADCVAVVDAVGFDGSLALEYTGKGDTLAVLRKAKEIVDKLTGAAEAPPMEPMDPLELLAEDHAADGAVEGSDEESAEKA